MKLETIKFTPNNHIILLFILLIILLIVILIKTKHNHKHNHNHDSDNDTFFINPVTTKYTLNNYNIDDKTRLYGSLFLDNQKQIIKNMTDSTTEYITKRIKLNNYSDILL